MVINLEAGENRFQKLPSVDAIVHLAGLARVPAGSSGSPAIWHTNVEATRSLARFAARGGVHLIYVSSAKVLGDNGEWDDAAIPAPADAYAISKLSAENQLRAEPELTYTILRPPLVYGPHVKGNFLGLLRLAYSGLPLPFAKLQNPRSLIFVDNLAAAILACLKNRAAAAGRVWLVSDGTAMEVAALFRHLANAMGRPARLFPFAPDKLLLLARLAGLSPAAEKLVGRFVVHDAEIRRSLDWLPPHPVSLALQKTADWYLSKR